MDVGAWREGTENAVYLPQTGTMSADSDGRKGEVMRRLWGLIVAGAVGLSGCAASPYDFPVPTVINGQKAYAMTGFVKAADEDGVRARLSQRLHCPNGLQILDLRTARADNAVGTKIMHYDAILKCKDGQTAVHSEHVG